MISVFESFKSPSSVAKRPLNSNLIGNWRVTHSQGFKYRILTQKVGEILIISVFDASIVVKTSNDRWILTLSVIEASLTVKATKYRILIQTVEEILIVSVFDASVSVKTSNDRSQPIKDRWILIYQRSTRHLRSKLKLPNFVPQTPGNSNDIGVWKLQIAGLRREESGKFSRLHRSRSRLRIAGKLPRYRRSTRIVSVSN